MLHFRAIFFIIILSFTTVIGINIWAAQVPKKTEFSDISIWKKIWEIPTEIKNSSVKIPQKYSQELEWVYQKYVLRFHTLLLKPTVDRSLFYRLRIQKYSLSCEITALQIVLDSLGIIVSENDILFSIPSYPFVYQTGGIWWDPDREFVWYYTGGQTKKTGYGIYEKPLAQYVQIYWLDTKIINQLVYTGTMNPWRHLARILQNLDNKNTHIILWWDWCTGSLYEDGIFSFWGHWSLRIFPIPAQNQCDRDSGKRLLYWTTPENKEVIWLSGEHAFVLLGYVWTIKNPTHIILWDTYTWRHIYPYSEWMRKWSLLQYRSLIISSEK